MQLTFGNVRTSWVRYDKYEYRTAPDGHDYLMPAKDAKPDFLNPLADAETLVCDALNVGRHAMNEDGKYDMKAEICAFAQKYGLLGLITALPTTPDFVDYEAVYLPKNRFFEEETMDTMRYVDHFFPFEKPKFYKEGLKSVLTIDDRAMLPLAMAAGDIPRGEMMSYLNIYGERFDWLLAQFQDWAFTYMTSFFYYHDYDDLNDDTKHLLQQSMVAFGGNVPHYHVALGKERPQLVWDFHSLLLCIQTMFIFLLTEEKTKLRMCEQCSSIFISDKYNARFCSHDCKNQYNVEKSRKKNSQ